MTTDPVEESRAGPVLRVRVRPRSRRDAVAGADARGLRVEVRGRPERGKANAAVLRTLGEWLGIPASRLALTGGETGRDKRVLVAGNSASDLRKRVAERLARDAGRTG